MKNLTAVRKLADWWSGSSFTQRCIVYGGLASIPTVFVADYYVANRSSDRFNSYEHRNVDMLGIGSEDYLREMRRKLERSSKNTSSFMGVFRLDKKNNMWVE